MKRTRITLEQIADLDNLAEAFWRARRGSPRATEARLWSERLDSELESLRADILGRRLSLGQHRAFRIFDPKPRLICAPCFRERVLHHALMRWVAPVLDRALVADTFACREGKGAVRAVARAQEHLRRAPWLVKIDIRSYFPSIDHGRLKALLRRRVKGSGALDLLDRIIDAYQPGPGKGLPIGALTSQHFANYYLSGSDRFLLDRPDVHGMVRYMDDGVWWCQSLAECHGSFDAAQSYLERELALEVKPGTVICPSSKGLPFCGFHVTPGAVRLSARRKRRYASLRKAAETVYAQGWLDANGLQARYAAALAITAYTDSRGFRREQLRRAPVRVSC